MAERFFKKEVQKLYLGAAVLADDTGKELEATRAELNLLLGGRL